MSYADAKLDGEKGIAEYRQGNLIEGLQLLQESAEQGYAPAQVTLAYIFDQSEQNKDAFYWYQMASEQNHPEALFGLGNMYAKAEGTSKDIQKAGELTEQAAQLDYLPAMRAYAYALEYGQLGFDKNDSESALWYLKAANSGDEVSMRRLKKAHANGELGLPVNTENAANWDTKINTKNQVIE